MQHRCSPLAAWKASLAGHVPENFALLTRALQLTLCTLLEQLSCALVSALVSVKSDDVSVVKQHCITLHDTAAGNARNSTAHRCSKLGMLAGIDTAQWSVRRAGS